MIEWLLLEKIQKLSLVITNITNKEVLERWDFKLQYEKSTGTAEDAIGNKDIKVIKNEIQNVLRQICSTVSFLPLLEGPCKYPGYIYLNVLETFY